MEVELINNENSFVFNISPLMPISYLRTLSQKSFNIPENLINLSYQNINIEKQYNDTSLKEYFKTSSRIIIKVSEEPKTLLKTFLNSTVTTERKTSNFIKFIQNEKKLSKKQFDITKTRFGNENEKKKDKCQICQKRGIDIFCREECKFLCKYDQSKNHNNLNHKFINIEQGNIEQCGYNYQKQLIKEIEIQENEIKDLIEKSSKERLNDIIEEVYDILGKIANTEREIMENFPCLHLDSITNTDYNEIKRNIYSINDDILKKKNPFSYKDKISFFKELQHEDFNIDNLNKDIESVKKKYDFQDMLCDILEQIKNNLNILNETLNKMWNENRYNIIAFSHDMEIIIKKMKKKFIIKESDSEEENSKDSELEEILFESKKNSNTGISGVILPKLSEKRRNQSNLPANIPLFSSVNLDRRKKVRSTLKTNNFDSDSEDSSEEIKSKRKFPPLTERNRNNSENKNDYINRGSTLNLDQVLLNENDLPKGPKRPPKRNSIRMSVFIRNMNKVDAMSTSKIMKVKKKKKKYM